MAGSARMSLYTEKRLKFLSQSPLFEGGTAEAAFDRFCVLWTQATSASATLKQGM